MYVCPLYTGCGARVSPAEIRGNSFNYPPERKPAFLSLLCPLSHLSDSPLLLSPHHFPPHWLCSPIPLHGANSPQRFLSSYFCLLISCPHWPIPPKHQWSSYPQVHVFTSQLLRESASGQQYKLFFLLNNHGKLSNSALCDLLEFFLQKEMGHVQQCQQVKNYSSKQESVRFQNQMSTYEIN